MQGHQDPAPSFRPPPVLDSEGPSTLSPDFPLECPCSQHPFEGEGGWIHEQTISVNIRGQPFPISQASAAACSPLGPSSLSLRTRAKPLDSLASTTEEKHAWNSPASRGAVLRRMDALRGGGEGSDAVAFAAMMQKAGATGECPCSPSLRAGDADHVDRTGATSYHHPGEVF